jgi:hypothetical protein
VAARSGQQYHEFWGTFATRADLPNVLGAATQKSYLQVGDYAWVTQELVSFRCLDATLGAAVWVAEPWDSSRRGIAPMIDDWISLGPAGQLGWSVSNSGAAASSQINNAAADADHLGIVEVDTGITAAGRSAIYLGTDGIVTPAAGGLIVAEATVQYPVLSDGVNTYISRLLLGDSLVAADHTDGIYFEYNQAVSGNFWTCKTAAGGVRTTVVTATAIAAGTWYRLRALIIPGAPSQALFYVDDVLVATITTNIPTGGQRYAPNLRITKTLGATSRSLLVDYFQMRSVTAQVR